jgi:hypothetical protein
MGISISAHAQVQIFDEFRTFRSGEFDLAGTFQYTHITGNYDNSSRFSGLPSGDSFSLVNGTLGGRWVFFPRVGTFVTTEWAAAQSKDLLKTRKNSSLTSATAGVDFLWLSHKTWALWPEFTLKYPFRRIDLSADDALNNEGAMEATARLVGRLRWESFDTFAYLGYRYRDEGRSGVMPFGAGAEVPVNNVNLGAELSGYQTVVNDSGTNNGLDRAFVAYRDGGSLYFDSVNPAALNANAWLRWKPNAYQFKFGGGTTLTGANYSGGWWAFVMLETQWQLSFSKSTPAPPAASQTYRNDHFEDELDDGVNQNLFVPPPPPAPPAEKARPAPLLEESAAPVVRPKQPTARERRQMRQEHEQQLQNDLDQTEMQIELKSKRDRGSGN